MNKKFVTFLLSAAILTGALPLSVYAADSTIAIETTADDVAGFSNIIGGNINWGSSNTILPTDAETPKENNVFLGIKGSYIVDVKNALKRINTIRKEACDEGVKDPRDKSRNLTPSDYVPIQWSSDLEYIARIRAAEASINRDHERLNGRINAFSMESPNGIRSWGEVLAWNGTQTVLQGIEQWYREKERWTENIEGVTGHYTQMIDPDNVYIGLATFVSSDGIYTTAAGEYSSQSAVDYDQNVAGLILDGSSGPAIKNCIQTVEVKKDKIKVGMSDFEHSLAASKNVQADFHLTLYGWKMELLSDVKWSSSNTKVATVNQKGKVTGVHEGTADITAEYEGLKVTKKIRVTGHANLILKDTKEPTCEEKGTKIYTCETCNETVKEEIPARGHKFGSWETIRPADLFSPEKQARVCTVCGKSEQRNFGSKIPGTMKINLSSITLKTKQKTKALKVTGLSKGDSVKSWKSSNTQIVNVTGKINGKCTITAGKKTGKAKIIITLKSGLKRTVTVSVQKNTVKTKKISKVPKTLKLQKKQKVILKPDVFPVTSGEKIRYISSNSKIAAVNAKGQITAKKKGTAVITVKSGAKTVKCKVTVK